MRVIEGGASAGLHNTSVALGTFDALHRGHREVIRAAAEYAQRENLLCAVYLFRVPPRAVLGGGEQKCVNVLEKRLKILRSLGVQAAVVEDFSPEYARTSCEDFVRFLRERLDAKAVFAGFNYHFGREGRGDASLLRELCKAHGMHCEIVSGVEQDGPVSSSRIRSLIEKGEMEEAARLLCRPYSVSGEVERGSQLGRKIGFPTANLKLPSLLAVPPDGVYVCRVRFEKDVYPAITNVGGKPTVSGEADRNIETHLIGFRGDLYGREIEVEFFCRIREIVKFASLEELKRQLEADKAFAIAFLSHRTEK